MTAPPVIHDLLDRIWDEGSGPSGLEIYKPILVGEYRFAAKLGGDARGTRIVTPPLLYPALTVEPDKPWLVSRWQGEFTEEEL